MTTTIDRALSKLEAKAAEVLRCDWCRSVANHALSYNTRDTPPDKLLAVTCRWCGRLVVYGVGDLKECEVECLRLALNAVPADRFRDAVRDYAERAPLTTRDRRRKPRSLTLELTRRPERWFYMKCSVSAVGCMPLLDGLMGEKRSHSGSNVVQAVALRRSSSGILLPKPLDQNRSTEFSQVRYEPFASAQTLNGVARVHTR
ncbi:MAG TPA: hypothetical protein VF659_06265 [Pyrinomonadaceae bacterium]|jgi:hypothetical protein